MSQEKEQARHEKYITYEVGPMDHAPAHTIDGRHDFHRARVGMVQQAEYPENASNKQRVAANSRRRSTGHKTLREKEKANTQDPWLALACPVVSGPYMFRSGLLRAP